MKPVTLLVPTPHNFFERLKGKDCPCTPNYHSHRHEFNTKVLWSKDMERNEKRAKPHTGPDSIFYIGWGWFWKCEMALLIECGIGGLRNYSIWDIGEDPWEDPWTSSDVYQACYFLSFTNHNPSVFVFIISFYIYRYDSHHWQEITTEPKTKPKPIPLLSP